ncbi:MULTISPECIES: hypothetical protein [Micromonospora]|uniref:hypothetical protein n=1 Tax=Micromonospora TaxID=1873 RepID=UPI0033CC4C2E
MERAVIWVPDTITEPVPPAAKCMSYAEEQGYHVQGVVHAVWARAEEMMFAGAVDVVIVADPAHLPAKRPPRIEVAGPVAAPDEVAGRCTPRRRRPRRPR